MTTKQSMLPIVMTDPHRDVLPHSYVVRKLAQHCKNCGSLHEYSELYSKTHLRSQWGHKYVTNLRRLHTPPEYNLRVEILETATEEVAFCHECFATVSLRHLPPIPMPEGPDLRTQLLATKLVQNSPVEPKPAPAKRSQRIPPTLNDVASLFGGPTKE